LPLLRGKLAQAQAVAKQNIAQRTLESTIDAPPTNKLQQAQCCYAERHLVVSRHSPHVPFKIGSLLLPEPVETIKAAHISSLIASPIFHKLQGHEGLAIIRIEPN
jgi:hypothetical protein